MKRLIYATILLCISLGSWALVPKTVELKKETAEMDLQIKYPQGYADKSIDTAVLAFIDALHKADTPKNQEKLPSDVPGKNSLYINYQTKFQNKQALSLLFSISSYSRGAAHPANQVKSLNFLNGLVVNLDQLFKPNSDYLAKIAKWSRESMMKKKISDVDWVTKGTQPNAENYKNWFFTKNGLAIVFDTYQVAAYVYGPQTVEIPKNELNKVLRPEIVNAVWGKQ